MQDQGREKRRTLAAFPSSVSTREPGLYTHMFVEDISNGLMGYRLNDDGRQVEVESDDAGKVASKAILSSLSEHPTHDLDDIIHAAVESIGRRLAWYGKAIYEICGTPEKMSLASIAPYHLFRVPGGFLQLVPKKERQWQREPRRYAFLPSRSAWVVRIPHELGGTNVYHGMLDQLTAVSQLAPKFWTRDLEAGRITTEFNISDYNRKRDAYIARLTRRWGWNRRDSSGTYTTEFFYFFRSLQFRKSQAILRNHIIDELNRFLPRQGIKTRILLKGFPNPEQIDDLIMRALGGSLHYAEALQQVR